MLKIKYSLCPLHHPIEVRAQGSLSRGLGVITSVEAAQPKRPCPEATWRHLQRMAQEITSCTGPGASSSVGLVAPLALGPRLTARLPLSLLHFLADPFGKVFHTHLAIKYPSTQFTEDSLAPGTRCPSSPRRVWGREGSWLQCPHEPWGRGCRACVLPPGPFPVQGTGVDVGRRGLCV